MTGVTRRKIIRLGVSGAALTFAIACGRRPKDLVTPSQRPDEETPRLAPEPSPTTTLRATSVKPSPDTIPTPTTGSEPTVPFFNHGSKVTVTQIEDFFTYTYHPQPPPQMPDFRLRVFGHVRQELNLALDDLLSMPVVEDMRTLECISNPVGGRLISNAVWRGVPMAHLLELAGASSRAIELKFECGDGYHTSVPVDIARDERSFLAYWMNGIPLPPKHGYPLRALWPGRYGQKQPKWITGIELISEPHLGHWERQGWSNEAVVVPNSRIDFPEKRDVVQMPITIRGTAFANQSGVTRVDVSTDNGISWNQAELIRGPSTLVWTEWCYEWSEAQRGSAVIRARVTDGDGRVQRFGNQRLPGGAQREGTDEQHSVAVTVKKLP